MSEDLPPPPPAPTTAEFPFRTVFSTHYSRPELTPFQPAPPVAEFSFPTLSSRDSRPGTPPPSPSPSPTEAAFRFPRALVRVEVPAGYFPIEVVQFWRGEHAPGHPLPLHWAIVVRTSQYRGNFHEIVGDTHTYAIQNKYNIRLRNGDDWRGSHVIGYVSPTRVGYLLNHIALVRVVRHHWNWNSQNWVYDVLRGLNGPGLYTDEKLTFEKLQTQMWCLWEAWEIGDI